MGPDALGRDLQLRLVHFLSWHEAVGFWGALGHRHAGWRDLVAALVSERGHDEGFLADLSALRDVRLYRPLREAYTELHPTVVRRALAHRYSPDRMLDHIVATDDVALLALLLEAHKRLSIDAPTLSSAVERGARRCLRLLLREADGTGGLACSSGPGVEASSGGSGGQSRVRIQYPRRHKAASQADGGSGAQGVDFGRFPQRLLWCAAASRDPEICDLVWAHVLARCGSGSEAPSGAADTGEAPEGQAQLWAACCGAATGFVPLLARCGKPPPQRVSFRVPAWAGPATASSSSTTLCEPLDFEDAPLVVVATSCGQPAALQELLRLGVDPDLCTRRGLTALSASERQPEELRAPLAAALWAAGAALWPPTGGTGGARGGGGPAGRPGSPISTAIQKGDFRTLKALIAKGARFQAEDILSAVKSGELEMLAFVQEQCQSTVDHAEYRTMMSKTAKQIREASRRRPRTPLEQLQAAGASATAGQAAPGAATAAAAAAPSGAVPARAGATVPNARSPAASRPPSGGGAGASGVARRPGSSSAIRQAGGIIARSSVFKFTA